MRFTMCLVAFIVGFASATTFRPAPRPAAQPKKWTLPPEEDVTAIFDIKSSAEERKEVLKQATLQFYTRKSLLACNLGEALGRGRDTANWLVPELKALENHHEFRRAIWMELSVVDTVNSRPHLQTALHAEKDRDNVRRILSQWLRMLADKVPESDPEYQRLLKEEIVPMS